MRRTKFLTRFRFGEVAPEFLDRAGEAVYEEGFVKAMNVALKASGFTRRSSTQAVGAWFSSLDAYGEHAFIAPFHAQQPLHKPSTNPSGFIILTKEAIGLNVGIRVRGLNVVSGVLNDFGVADVNGIFVPEEITDFVQVGRSVFFTGPGLANPFRVFGHSIDALSKEFIFPLKELSGLWVIDKDVDPTQVVALPSTGAAAVFESLPVTSKIYAHGFEGAISAIANDSTIVLSAPWSGPSLYGVQLFGLTHIAGVPISQLNEQGATLIDFYQGRLILAGFDYVNSSPSTRVVMSANNNFAALKPGNALSNSPLDFEVTTRDVENFTWMLAGSRALFIGGRREVLVNESAGIRADEPATVAFRTVHAGTAKHARVTQDEQGSIYVAAESGGSLQRINFQTLSEVFAAVNLNQFSPHLSEGAIRAEFMPEVVGDQMKRVYVVKSSGDMTVWSATPGNDIGGWARWQMQEHLNVKDALRLNNSLYLILSRTGSTERSVVKVIADDAAAFKLDLSATLTSGVATTSWVTTNPALFSKYVWTAVGGRFAGFVLVSGAGAFTTLIAGTSVTFGLLFESYVDIPRPVVETREGTSLHKPQQIYETVVHVLDTAALTINGHKVLNDLAPNLNVALPRQSKVVTASSVGSPDAGEVTRIEAVDGYNMTVASIVFGVQAGD